jgi:hypothetical protein
MSPRPRLRPNSPFAGAVGRPARATSPNLRPPPPQARPSAGAGRPKVDPCRYLPSSPRQRPSKPQPPQIWQHQAHPPERCPAIFSAWSGLAGRELLHMWRASPQASAGSDACAARRVLPSSGGTPRPEAEKGAALTGENVAAIEPHARRGICHSRPQSKRLHPSRRDPWPVSS